MRGQAKPPSMQIDQSNVFGFKHPDNGNDNDEDEDMSDKSKNKDKDGDGNGNGNGDADKAKIDYGDFQNVNLRTKGIVFHFSFRNFLMRNAIKILKSFVAQNSQQICIV